VSRKRRKPGRRERVQWCAKCTMREGNKCPQPRQEGRRIRRQKVAATRTGRVTRIQSKEQAPQMALESRQRRSHPEPPQKRSTALPPAAARRQKRQRFLPPPQTRQRYAPARAPSQRARSFFRAAAQPFMFTCNAQRRRLRIASPSLAAVSPRQVKHAVKSRALQERGSSQARVV